MQTFKVGIFHHRFIQTGVPLYSEFMYRYKPSSKIGLSAGIGAGYLHMFPGDEQFRQNESGGWDVIKMKSRPQGMISLSLGIDYQITSSGNKAFIRYQNVLLENIKGLKEVGISADGYKAQMNVLLEISEHINKVQVLADEMTEARKAANALATSREKAIAYCEKVKPYFDEIRYSVDKLELLVDDSEWELPKYRELLFMR
jgi:hypothetical protein